MTDVEAQKIVDLLAGKLFDGVNPDTILRVISEHHLLPYFFSLQAELSEELIEFKKMVLMKQQLAYQLACKDLVHVIQIFETQGVDYRSIKGIALAQEYPTPFTRVMGDLDIIIRPEMLNQATMILEEIGYNRCEKDFSNYNSSFHRKGHISIELHKELFDPDSMTGGNEILVAFWSKYDSIRILDQSIKVPTHEDHFKYLIMHMLKHFKSGGFGIRNLLDIVHFCNQHQIDCQFYDQYFTESGLGAFYKAIISICVYSFDLKVEDRRWLYSKEDGVVEDLMDYIVQSGAFGKAGEALTVRRLYSQHAKPYRGKKGVAILLGALFPSVMDIPYYYTYVKKQPLFLPIGWIHRWVRFVVRPDWSLKTKLFIFTKDKVGFDRKDRMMKALGFYLE